jgi:hypothetical protein
LAWVQADTGTSFVLALKRIFEDELLKCFHQSYLTLSGAGQYSFKDLQKRVDDWKAAEDNVGKSLQLLDLVHIMANNMPGLTLPGITSTEFTRRAEAATERFMRRGEVAAELQNNGALRKAFLHDIRSWIANGAFGENQDFIVQQTYHDALLSQYQEKLKTNGVDGNLSGQLKLAGMQWWQDNEARVLTTAQLDTLFVLAEYNTLLDGIGKAQ